MPSHLLGAAQHLFVGDRERNAAAFPNRFEYQEISHRRGNAQPVRNRLRALPGRGKLIPLLKRAHHRRAAAALYTDHTRPFASDQAHLLHLFKRLPHAHQPGAAARRIDDDIRHAPAQLLNDLIAHRLFALNPVGLL